MIVRRLLLPESNLHLRAAGCCALPARPAPGSKGVSATWFPAVFAGDFVWGRGGAGAGAAGREWAMSCQSERAAGRQNRGRAARAQRELRCAPVRPGSIEAPAPSAALCEVTTSAARSTPSLGVIAAGSSMARSAFLRLWPGFRGQCGRMCSLRVARRRIWPHREAVDRPRLAIEPGRTGAQRSSRRARAARPHFSRTVPTWRADVRMGRG